MPSEVATNPNICANCGQPLHGPYCSRCGQHVKDFHRSLWRFMVDFFDNVFCWDNKLFVTLKPLFRRPGALTLDYLSGRRARYVHPLRLFLFTSAVCLTIIQFFGGSPAVFSLNDHPAGSTSGGMKVRFAAGLPAPAPTTAPVDATVTPEAAAQPSAIPQVDPTQKKGGFSEMIEHKVKAKLASQGGAERFQREVIEGVQRQVSWVVLALLPVFALLLRAMYWRGDSYYFAHFVFSLHYHTGLLIFGAAFALLDAALPSSTGPWRGLLNLPLLVVPGVYLFLALRRMYGESIARTLAKVLLLGALHMVSVIVGLSVVGTLAMYYALR